MSLRGTVSRPILASTGVGKRLAHALLRCGCLASSWEAHLELVVLAAGLYVVGIGVLFSQVGRVKKLEATLEHLRQWHQNLMWRVYALETNSWNRPSSAYRTTASEHAAERPAPIEQSFVPKTEAKTEFVPPDPSQPTDEAPAKVATVETLPPRAEPSAAASPETRATDEPQKIQPAVDWERWVGVRGAAALGAGILVIALLYFLRYSIDAGWLTIGHRVVLGALLSVAGLGVSELRLKKTHTVLANWVEGASIAGLYASAWAGEHLAGFYGPFAAFAIVVFVTAFAFVLALRKSSLPIALLGMSGAFAAPLSLALSDAAPAGIIAYVAVLDIAMVALAMRKKWWVLSLLSLGATSVYEAMWMHASPLVSSSVHAGLLVVVAGVFGALPAFAMGESEDGSEAPAPLARAVRFASVLLPLGFALRLALATDVSTSPMPLVAVTCAVAAMSIAIGRRRKEHGLALVVSVLSAGILVVADCIAPDAPAIYPVAIAAVAVGGLYAARFRDADRNAAAMVALVAFGLSIIAIAHRGESGNMLFPIGLTAVSAFIAAMIGRTLPNLRDSELGTGLRHGSRIAAFVILLALTLQADQLGIGLYGGMAAFLAAILVTAGTDKSFLPFTLGVAASLGTYEIANPNGMVPAVWTCAALLGIGMVLVPFLPFTELLAGPKGPRAQAFAIVAFGLVVGIPLFDRGIFSPGIITATAALVSAMAVTAVHFATDVEATREAGRRWLGTLSLGTLTASLACTLDRAPLTCSLAVLGFLLVALYRRLGREALGWVGIGYLAAAGVRLMNPAILSCYPRGAMPVLDWITPTFLIPAACAFGSYRLLVRTNAPPIDAAFRKIVATLGLVLTFAWLNVAVLDVFSHGEYIVLDGTANEARDLAMSFTWALFGVGLLVAGMARGSGALRKASLVIVLSTMAKVFLYDLSELGSLYRVASLVGLAGSLIGISILYQRFIFRKPPPAAR